MEAGTMVTWLRRRSFWEGLVVYTGYLLILIAGWIILGEMRAPHIVRYMGYGPVLVGAHRTLDWVQNDGRWPGRDWFGRDPWGSVWVPILGAGVLVIVCGWLLGRLTGVSFLADALEVIGMLVLCVAAWIS